MEELIKNFLYWVAIGAGSTMIICLLISGLIRCLCILMDHLKTANVIREAMILYAKTKRPDLNIIDYDVSKARYKKSR